MEISGRKQALINRFYRELQKWIDGGCKNHPVFSKDNAICAASNLWVTVNFPKMRSTTWMWPHLTKAFENAGLNSSLPFNNNNTSSNGYCYSSERVTDSIYKNPHRLKWIKDHAVSGARKRGPKDTLRNYLRRLQTWVENGCVKHPIFRNDFGICDNVKTLLRANSVHEYDAVRDALCEKLPTPPQGDKAFPFNGGSLDSYSCEVRDETLWKNSQRLAWLRENCA